MSKNKINDQTPLIVKDKIVMEEIQLQGKTVLRERIEKEWNIPKIITSDIGYQLMFGNKPSINRSKQDSGIVEVHLKKSGKWIIV